MLKDCRNTQLSSLKDFFFYSAIVFRSKRYSLISVYNFSFNFYFLRKDKNDQDQLLYALKYEIF